MAKLRIRKRVPQRSEQPEVIIAEEVNSKADVIVDQNEFARIHNKEYKGDEINGRKGARSREEEFAVEIPVK